MKQNDRFRSGACCVLTFIFLVLGVGSAGGAASGDNARFGMLIIRGQGQAFDDAIKGIADECRDDFRIHQMTVSDSTSRAAVGKMMQSVNPAIVVLMDNKAIELFKEYQKALPDTAPRVPSVALMGILIARAMQGIQNTQGISYEVPIVTSAIGLRTVLHRPINKIGVIYRNIMADFIGENIKYCKMENIEIVPFAIASSVTNFKDEVKKGLKELLKDKGVDALWVPNDNVILKPDVITDAWLPMIDRYRKPVIVGVEMLVSPKINFGTFAVLPDHVALGKQASDIIYAIKSNNWKIEKLTVDPPVSVSKIINGMQAKEYFHLDKKACENVDRIAE